MAARTPKVFPYNKQITNFTEFLIIRVSKLLVLFADFVLFANWFTSQLDKPPISIKWDYRDLTPKETERSISPIVHIKWTSSLCLFIALWDSNNLPQELIGHRTLQPRLFAITSLSFSIRTGNLTLQVSQNTFRLAYVNFLKLQKLHLNSLCLDCKGAYRDIQILYLDREL